MSDQSFDVIVIGAGPAGEALAGQLAGAGKSVAIAERELIGGECSYWACMPSKALLRPHELLNENGRVPGVPHGDELDVPAVLARRDEVIHDLDDSGQLPWLEDRGITLLRGVAKLDGEKRVVVGDDGYEAREAVVVAVGSGALLPPIDGLADAAPWTNREITTAKEVPERLVVLGGGVVGTEMADAWASFGVRVTMVEGGERLMGRVEPFASEQVADALRARGVDVRLGVRAERVVRDDSGEVTVTLEDGETVAGDELLVAIGREPRTQDLGLETVGLEPGKSIEVDDGMRVPGREWLHAIGDVNGRQLLTHMGKYQSRIAFRRIMGDENAKVADLGAQPPQVIFTDPQVAAVGHTLESAQDAGIDARAIDLSTSGTAGASFYGRDTAGTTRFVIDTAREVIVGATFVGFEVADMIHAATIAIAGAVPMSTLAHAVPSFPTRAEIWLNLQEAWAAG
jgi:dihydrolipoamide dehydrogenase